MKEIRGWNYRILEHKDNENNHIYYSVHEVYYNKDNEIVTFSKDPISIIDRSQEEIIQLLESILKDCKRQSLITAEEINKLKE